MRIDKSILEAIKNAVADKYKSNAQLALACGVTGATVGRWRDGTIRSIEDKAWEKTAVALAPWLHSPAHTYEMRETSCYRCDNLTEDDITIARMLNKVDDAWIKERWKKEIADRLAYQAQKKECSSS